MVKMLLPVVLLLGTVADRSAAIRSRSETQTMQDVPAKRTPVAAGESADHGTGKLQEDTRLTRGSTWIRKLLDWKHVLPTAPPASIQENQLSPSDRAGSYNIAIKHPLWMDESTARSPASAGILEAYRGDQDETAGFHDGSTNRGGNESVHTAFPSAGRYLAEEDEEELPHECTLRPVEKDVVKEKLLVLREKWKQGRIKVYVQHMNKGGGTTLCRFFSKSALSVPQASNCNGKPSFAPYTKGDARSMKELFEIKPYQVYFNEGPMFRQPLDTSHFIFLTSIRKPHYRVISQLLHHWQGKYRYLENGAVDGLEELLKRYIDHGSLQGRRSIYTQNMQTWHLLGRKNADDPAVAFEQAVDRLFEFALTIPTDEMGQGLDNLGRLFYPSMRPLAHNSHLNVHDAASQVDFLLRDNADFLASLKQQNMYDQCLYHQARALHKVQTEVLKELSLE
eukprot:scaffold365_cov361-Pavlova_lutheri.AAC.7